MNPLARILLVSCVALVCACGGRTIGGNANVNQNASDAAVHPDGRVPDAAVGPDSGIPDGGVTCETQDHWLLTLVPLTSIEVLNPMWGGDGIPEGVAVRVRATVTVTGCDELAGVRPEVAMESRSIVLTGYVWQYLGTRTCGHEARDEAEYLVFPDLPAGEGSVMDYLVNDPGVPFLIRSCASGEDCFCDAWPGPPGGFWSSCAHDCMCVGSLDCVYDGWTVSPGGGCLQTCSVSSDCPQPEFCAFGFNQTPEGTCLATGLIEECLDSVECPPGWSCLPQGGFQQCWPSMGTNAMGMPCDVDCDCPAGLACVDLGGDQQQSCQIRCRGNRDCPSGTGCDITDPMSGAHQPNLLLCQFLPD